MAKGRPDNKYHKHRWEKQRVFRRRQKRFANRDRRHGVARISRMIEDTMPEAYAYNDSDEDVYNYEGASSM